MNRSLGAQHTKVYLLLAGSPCRCSSPEEFQAPGHSLWGLYHPACGLATVGPTGKGEHEETRWLSDTWPEVTDFIPLTFHLLESVT